MSETLARALVYAMGGYAAIGFVFAVAFVSRGVSRLDSEAQGTGLGFRLLIFPGVMAFWPMFLLRWARGVYEPPTEKNPHRSASELGVSGKP